MRGILIIILLFTSSSFQKVEFEQIDFDKFCTEMRMFIEHSKTESILNGKYNVYLAKFNEGNGFECCVTMEYIFSKNQYVPELEMFDYFTMIDSNLVLMSFNQFFREKFDFNDRRIKQLDDTSIIANQLYKEVFFGDGSAVVSCFSDGGISRENYQNDSYVPDNKRIFEFRNNGVIRKIDSTEFINKQPKKKY